MNGAPTVAVVQARLTSTRLPAKVLKPLGSKEVLRHVVDRLANCRLIDEVVIATTTDCVDDPLVEFCRQHGLTCFRGDRDDVLSRFYHCAAEHSAASVVRVTSDNPLVDWSVVDRTIGLFHEKSADYAANNLRKSFPHGLDVEVISFAALAESYQRAIKAQDREHVTQYVRYRPEIYHLENLYAGGDWQDIRLTLDYDEDYQMIALVMRLLGEEASFQSIIDLFWEFPALRRVNDAAREQHAMYNRAQGIV
jgi:spore coat polysaccharide biosynthesis protein SpsF